MMSIYYQIVKLLISIGVPKENTGSEPMYKVIDYMYENYRKPIGIHEFAAAARMSESNLYARFKKQFGVSPIAYLNHYRLTLASDMLKESDLRIGEIAERVGFSDQLYFSKLFKRTFNASPGEYRKTY